MKHFNLKRHFHVVIFCTMLAIFLFTGMPAFAQNNVPRNTPAAQPVVAQTPASPQFSPASIPAKTRLMEETLPNGFRIIIQERPGTGIVGTELLVKVGLMQEMEMYAGITSLIQSLLLTSKTAASPKTFQEAAESDGCLLHSSASPDYAVLNMVATPDIFRNNLKRLASTIKTPDFEQKALDEQKEEQTYNIEGNKSAFQMINEIFLNQFYRYHPYRQPVYGFKNTVNRMKIEEIQKFYNENYSANRMTLAIVGDVNAPETMDLCKKIFADLPRQKNQTVDIPWEPVGAEKKLYLETNSELAWVFVGFPAPDIKSPDYPKMKVLETLLGDGLSSRLFIELREKEGLAYELSSTYPQLEGPSHMILYIVTNGKGLSKSRKKMFDEINKLKKWKISQEELDATKRKLLGKYLLDNETASSQAHNLAYYTALGLGHNFNEVLLRRMQDVTVDDVQNMARKYFENYTVLEIQPSQDPEMFAR
ncbi:MAG: insulinase family protein [Firmicutes bacterium]|nr:insulinase family protein [Bacillota bacterium]